jgi:hypothetical protein
MVLNTIILTLMSSIHLQNFKDDDLKQCAKIQLHICDCLEIRTFAGDTILPSHIRNLMTHQHQHQ